MFNPIRIKSWVLLLFVALASLWPTYAGLAQKPSAPGNIKAKQSGAPRNPNRQQALLQMKAAAEARAQKDPNFKTYLDALKAHDKQVKAYIAARKGGAQ